MKNEGKIIEMTNVSEQELRFQQPEPAELNEADLVNVAGGVGGERPLLPSV